MNASHTVNINLTFTFSQVLNVVSNATSRHEQGLPYSLFEDLSMFIWVKSSQLNRLYFTHFRSQLWSENY